MSICCPGGRKNCACGISPRLTGAVFTLKYWPGNRCADGKPATKLGIAAGFSMYDIGMCRVEVWRACTVVAADISRGASLALCGFNYYSTTTGYYTTRIAFFPVLSRQQ